MRRVFWILVLFNVLLLPAMYFLLPDRVATHFDIAGQPNGWGSKTEFIRNISIMDLAIVIFFAPFARFSKYFIKNCPAWLVNIPNKSYWMQEENLPLFYKKIDSTCWQTGCIVMITPIFTEINSIICPQAGNNILFFVVFMFIVTCGFLVQTCLSYRIPKDKNMETPNNF